MVDQVADKAVVLAVAPELEHLDKDFLVEQLLLEVILVAAVVVALVKLEEM
jgi:hypothetical protein